MLLIEFGTNKTEAEVHNGCIGFHSGGQKSLVAQQYKLIVTVDGYKYELHGLVRQYMKRTKMEGYHFRITKYC